MSRFGRGILRKKATHQGNIETVDGTVVSGWIASLSDSDCVTIDIDIDGVRRATAVRADGFREDLREAGIGNGRYGFAARVDDELRSGAVKVDIFEHGKKRLLLTYRVSQASETGLGAGTRDSISIGSGSYSGEIEGFHDGQLLGWVARSSQLGEVFDVDVLVNGEYYSTTTNSGSRPDLRQLGLTGGKGGIALELPSALVAGSEQTLALRLPDGSVTLPWVMLDARVPWQDPPPLRSPQENVSIVVPIFNAAEDLETCLDRLLEYTTTAAQLLLIDDASTDSRVGGLLSEVEAVSNVRVLRNRENLGYTRTINLGLVESGRDDVVILNSDARVTPRWLEGLRRAAACDPRIGTVTPFSDRAGAFSAPTIGNNNSLPAGVDEADYARALRRRSLGQYPSVPTGNGFCMYIRRACLDDVGMLDEAAFPRGYGEENDLCMRAGALGWRHVIDDRTYVFHARSKSFGGMKVDLVEQGRAVVDARYPNYKQEIAVFRDGTGIGIGRHRARLALRDCSSPEGIRPRALFVIATQSGGTPQTNSDLMRELSDSWETWLLHCDSHTITLSRTEGSDFRVIRQHSLTEPVDATRHDSFEYDRVVANWLDEFEFEIVHIRHLVWHGLSLPKLARESGAAVVMSFHDFYSICPTVNLIDEQGKFCGGECSVSDGECSVSIWPQNSLPKLKHNWVKDWRKKFTVALQPVDAFVTTSESAKATIIQNLPDIQFDQFDVVPHGRDFPEFHQAAVPIGRNQALNILVPGNISKSKGRDVIAALLDHDKDGLLRFHVLGSHDFTIDDPRLIFHGSYQRQEFSERARSIGANVGAVFSTWDETYCHTLTELWSVGLPTIVLDYPTLASRVRASGGGWVLDRWDVGNLYRSIISRCLEVEEVAEKTRCVLSWQEAEGRFNTTRNMAAKYHEIYRTVLGEHHAQVRPFRREGEVQRQRRDSFRVAVVGPATNDQRRANASTHVRLWERTRNSVEREITYIRMTPNELAASVESGAVRAAVLQRDVLPQSIWSRLKPFVAEGKFHFILDLDDDLLNVPENTDPVGVYADYRETLLEIMEWATFVTVSTPALFDHITALRSGEVVLLPNRISKRLWAGRLESTSPDETCRALYMGTPTHDADFAMIWPALESVAQRHPNFRVRVIGSLANPPETPPDWLEIVDVPDECKNYPEFVAWLKTHAVDADFGLAPLADTAFNRNKSPLKILDYAGLGLPTLGSAVPPYEVILSQAPGAIAVENLQGAWESALEDAVVGRGQHRIGRSSEILEWVMDHNALEDSLPEFDALVLSSILGESTMTHSALGDPKDVVPS